MEDILVPIFICVVLPVAVVYIIFRCKENADNRHAEVLIKAIESNNNVNADKLVETLRKPIRSAREVLNLRLLRGIMFSLLGIGALVYSIYLEMTIPELDYQYVSYIVAGVSLAIGISYLLVYFTTRNQIDDQNAER